MAILIKLIIINYEDSEYNGILKKQLPLYIYIYIYIYIKHKNTNLKCLQF